MAGTLLVSNMWVPNDLKTEAIVDTTCEYYVDGTLVTAEMYKFCTELRRHHAFKQCRFGVENEWQSTSINKSVWVYSPDEIFARGQIGYGDIGVVAIMNKFYVETEQIRNNKVKTSRRQHNMKSSDNMERMIVASKQHLRPYPLEKIVSLTAYQLTTSLSAEKAATSEAEGDAMGVMKGMLTRNGPLTAELANMVKTDYPFKDEFVREAIVSYMATIDNDIEVCSRNVSIALVLVHPPQVGSDEHAITVQMGQKHLNLRSRIYTGDVLSAFEGSPVMRYTPETLPQDIRQKISSLNILDNNTYVDKLGLRQSENIYYIAEDA